MQNIILLGPPGSGKGTQATKLSEKLNLKKISTGDIIRDHISRGTELGLKVKSIVTSGGLVPDELIIELFECELENVQTGFVADGFPRTKRQAEQFDALIEANSFPYPIVFYLKVEQDNLIKRMAGRRTCSTCKKVFNVFFAPPKKENVCDFDGGELICRDDDKEEVVLNRFKVYESEIAPVLNFYNQKLITVDASKNLEDVFSQMFSHFNLV